MRAWEDFVRKQEELLGKKIVDEWLRPLKVVHFDSGNLYLEAKDSFHVLWFEEHIRPLLKKHLLNNNFRPIKVHLTAPEASHPTEKKQKKEKFNTPPAIQIHFDSLDPSMTLDNFIVGEDNKVIFRFLSEWTSSPQDMAKFNPIYIWGNPGCGKTHLLMALAQQLRAKGLNALYAKAETFTEHVVSAIRNSEMQTFRKAYRHVEVLLIDDVHIFSRKSATQEEFFHTFNTLHTSGRPIILSSSCAPASLEEIEPRLVSRFEWGINIHLQKLKNQEGRQMLLKRCESLHFPLDNEVIDFLVHTFKSSQSLNRALEALVLRSHLAEDARYKRNPSSLNKATVEKVLADLIATEQTDAPTPEKIISSVSAIYGLKSEDLLGKSQSQECSLPRQIAMYLCRHQLKMTFEGIGQLFKRDHSTVMTSIRQIDNKIKSDQELAHLLTQIKI